MFERYDALIAGLGAGGIFESLGKRGEMMQSKFEFHEPAPAQLTTDFRTPSGHQLPDAYQQFLQKNDGCVLFRDPKYCQWGAILHGIQAHGDLESMSDLNKQHQNDIDPKYWLFGSWYGDLDLFAFDLSSPKQLRGLMEYPIVVFPQEGWRPEGETLAITFAMWIDGLMGCHGEKWWEWKNTY